MMIAALASTLCPAPRSVQYVHLEHTVWCRQLPVPCVHLDSFKMKLARAPVIFARVTHTNPKTAALSARRVRTILQQKKNSCCILRIAARVLMQLRRSFLLHRAAIQQKKTLYI